MRSAATLPPPGEPAGALGCACWAYLGWAGQGLSARHSRNSLQAPALRCRELQAKFAELEDQLAAARRAQRDGAEQRRRAEAAAERLQGRCAEASAKQAELNQQLW